MKNAKLILVCFVLIAGFLRSQIYPVQISAQLVPPYSGYLPDYADPTAERLKVILQFNDFSQTQYDLKLKFEIKGNGFTISTKALFNPPPITLLPGQPLLLSGADLAPYLNTNNLDFVGINQSQYQQKMALPEGYYSVCVKAYDYYNTNPIQVSNEACANAWFTLSDPPYLNLPICNTAITPLTPQNIIFQWTPVNMGSPLSALNTEYEFSLYECRPDSNANPNQVVLSTAPIFSTTTQQTFFNYGLAEPPLNLYMKYIWRVRAKDATGRDLFKNNGYSQICTFTYGTVKNVFGNTLGLSLSARPLNHRSGECTWSKQSVYSKYLLQVRKKNTNYWFDFPNTIGLERIPNLEPKTVYECRVRGEAGSLIGEWSDIAEFKTLDPPNYSCNDNTLAPFNSLQPLPPDKAVTGLVIQSGQFEVIATQISGNGPPGWYKGKGYAMIFGLLPVAVKWDNIFIDVDQRQQQGIIEALTEGVDKWISDWEVKQAEANATYVDGEIDTVYVSGNSICYKMNGNPNVFCTPVPTGVNVVVIRDSEGNQYTVHLQPPPPKVVGPTNYINISSDNLDATDNFKVVFESDLNQSFGFDKKEYAAFMDNYEAIKLSNNKIYFVPNKSIGENSTDAVIATYTITGYSPSQLSFKTQNGQVISATTSGNNLKLTGIPADANCIYAYCDNKRIGKLNIISLKQLSKKLVLVPVNGANVNLTANGLDSIYKQANVVWTVTTTSGFSFSLGNDGLENADATLMSKYSTEMRALRDAYKAANSNYDKDAYYVFVVPNFADATTVGYMVRGRALGFVRNNASSKEIAHELAHGAFGLEHTFPSAEKESTNNLLDYTNGAVLVKGQWEKMQDPGIIYSWNDGEEDASLAQSEYFAKYMPDLTNPLIGDGLTPKALWNNTGAAASGLSTVCGLIDAVAEDVGSLWDVAKFFHCWNLLISSPECDLVRAQTLQTGGFVITLMKCTSPLMFTDNEKCDPLNIEIFKEIKKYAVATTDLTYPEAMYLSGKLVYFVGGCFVGLTELKAGLTGVKVAAALDKLRVFLPKIQTIIKAFSSATRIVKKTTTGIALIIKLNASDVTFATINTANKILDIKVPLYPSPTGGNVIEKFSYDAVKVGNQTYNNKTVEIINDNGALKCRVSEMKGNILKVGDNIIGITIKQIREGTNGKYAIIGRSMGNAELTGVRNVYSQLKNVQKLDVEIFDPTSLSGTWKTKFDEALSEFSQKTNNWTTLLPNQELLKLKMYKLNKEWAQFLVDSGYTILDLGDFNNLGFSAFYAMEKMTIFK